MVSADIFLLKIFMCIVAYYSKFSTVKKADSIMADDLVKAAKIVFAEFWLPKKIIPDARKEFHIRETQTILQTDAHTKVNNIILSPPEQWSVGGKYKIHKIHNQNMLHY